MEEEKKTSPLREWGTICYMISDFSSCSSNILQLHGRVEVGRFQHLGHDAKSHMKSTRPSTVCGSVWEF